MTKDEVIINRLQEHLDSALAAFDNPDWFVICLQGSQNYGLDDEESDIDSKLLVIPSLDDIVFNRKPISHTHIMENDEHCDVKDIREYFRIVRKQNVNFVEIFFSKWWIVNPKYKDEWGKLQYCAENIAHLNPYNAVKAMYGMAMEKRHALCHEYPSRMPWIEKYGFDPKQLSHLLRIERFISMYIEGRLYKDCIDCGDVLYLLNVKRNTKEYDKDTAIKIADKAIIRMKEMVDVFCESCYKNNDEMGNYILNTILSKIIKQSIKEELIGED